MHVDVIVIGGGIAGLACATALGDHGLQVLLLERGDCLGGRARSWTDETSGDRIDIGPHILLTEYRNMLRFLEQLGTRDQLVWQQGKFLTLVDEPGAVEIRMHRLPAPLHFLPSMLSAPQVSARDLISTRRLLWQVLRLNQADVLRLDQVDAESHLRRLGVSPRMLDWFWRSACMSIMNVPLERCSAGALLSFFRYMIGISGYQVGFAGQGLGDLFAPAAVRRIERAGGQVRLRAEVEALIAEGEQVQGVRLIDGTQINARHCIATVPPQDLQPLLPPAWVERHGQFADLAQVRPSPYISSYLWFDRKLGRERFWARVWSPGNLNYDSYDLSNIRTGWAARPSVIASNIIYSQRAAPLTDDQIIEATLRELSDHLPEVTRARVRHTRVHRIAMAIPVPYPGSEARRPDPRTPIAGLYLAGDWLRTGLPASMEGAVRAGWLAAETVLAREQRPQALALDPPAVDAVARLLGRGSQV
jgi:squalene-associated FAD-dependent desaturase